MKKRSCLMILALCLLLTACGPAGQSEPAPAGPDEAAASAPEETAPEAETLLGIEMTDELSERERGWIEDIEYLRTEYKARHMDPFYLCPEEEFDWKLDRLEAKVGELSDEDIFYEINAVIAGMGDIHTVAYDPDLFYGKRFPARARYFDGKLYLTAYKEGYEELAPYLLREIVAVNGVDVAFIDQKVDTGYSSFNSWLNRENFYFLPAFYDWAGCDYTDGYTFQILNDNQEVESVALPAVSYQEISDLKWIYPESWDERFYVKGGSWTKYVEGENDGAVYLAMDDFPIGSPSITKRYAQEIGKLFEEHPECKKLVVDFRCCPGGDASILSGFQENIELLEADQVYVLTSGRSASAATTFMAFFKKELGAVFVGEPTGQFSSFFHLSTSVLEPAVLPHSQIMIQISDSWYDGTDQYEGLLKEYYDEDGRLYPWESTILPDVYVYQDIEDIRQGKDSVMEWVLAQ